MNTEPTLPIIEEEPLDEETIELPDIPAEESPIEDEALETWPIDPEIEGEVGL